MNPYDHFLQAFDCSSFQVLYSYLECLAISAMNMDGLPFPLSALEQPKEGRMCPEIHSLLVTYHKLLTENNSDTQVIKLLEFLQENPPKESYDPPKIPNDGACTREEKQLIMNIFNFGIDLPGSKHRPFGNLQYYSSFFIDIFFGNMTEGIGYINSLSVKEVKKALRKREGFCQFSPIFAPILGLRMANLEENPLYTSRQRQEIRTMYSGNNENKHLEILKKLLKKGANANDHDLYGNTPLHHVMLFINESMVAVLLKYGANPNAENRAGTRPLDIASCMPDTRLAVIDMLIQHNAKPSEEDAANRLRTSVEKYGSKDLIVRVRKACPRDKNKCERCVKSSEKMCSACGLVYYCTPACQKLDWKFHKISCDKKYKDY